jgi:hypothetical protein
MLPELRSTTPCIKLDFLSGKKVGKISEMGSNPFFAPSGEAI